MARSACGLRGFLLNTAGFEGGSVTFRVYRDSGEFDDYQMRLFDLEIEILDRDAYLYEESEPKTLDYSPQTKDYSK